MKEVINLFTHTDLDGVACSVLIHLQYRNRDAITVQYCEPGNVDLKLYQFMNTIEQAEHMHQLPEVKRTIYITDLPLKSHTMSKLNDFCKQRSISLLHLDHHEPKQPKVTYPWSHIDTRSFQCAAAMLYRYLEDHAPNYWIPRAAVSFVDEVRQRDTWEFDSSRKTNADCLDILLKLVGRDYFELTVTNHFIIHPGSIFTVAETGLLPAVDEYISNRNKYMNLRNQNLRKVMYKGYVVGVVFAEQHISHTAHYVLSNNPDLDICAVVNFPVSVSLRTDRADINLAEEIAHQLGGGGHAKAAAYPIFTSPHKIRNLLGFDLYDPEGEHK